MSERWFRNTKDNLRARVYKLANGRWDVDMFTKLVIGGGWRIELGWCGQSTCRTREMAVQWIEDHGLFHELPVRGSIVDGWPEREPPKVTKDAHIPIEIGQTWRQGTRTLRVTDVSAHWQKDNPMKQISYIWTAPSGRERGKMIVGRRHAQTTGEQNFREKFRYVPEED